MNAVSIKVLLLLFPPLCPFAGPIFSQVTSYNTACFALVTSHPRLVPKFSTMWRIGCMKGRHFLKCPAKWKVICQSCVSLWKTISKLLEWPFPWPMWNFYTISWRHLWPCRLSPTVGCASENFENFENFLVLFPAWRCCCSILVFWPTNIHAGKSDRIIRT
jgi:hypothetical protein